MTPDFKVIRKVNVLSRFSRGYWHRRQICTCSVARESGRVSEEKRNAVTFVPAGSKKRDQASNVDRGSQGHFESIPAEALVSLDLVLSERDPRRGATPKTAISGAKGINSKQQRQELPRTDTSSLEQQNDHRRETGTTAENKFDGTKRVPTNVKSDGGKRVTTTGKSDDAKPGLKIVSSGVGKVKRSTAPKSDGGEERLKVTAMANERSVQKEPGKCVKAAAAKKTGPSPQSEIQGVTGNEDFPAAPPGPHRYNELNIQMLPSALHKQVFGRAETTATPQAVARARAELKRHGLLREPAPPLPDPGLRLPPLRGRDVEEHFLALGEEQAAPYRRLLQRLAATAPPPRPAEWLPRAGWTRYGPGRPPEEVPVPACDALVLDVEVCKAAGEAPVLATAVSPDAWYCWVSPRLFSGAVGPPLRYSSDDFLPLDAAPGDPASGGAPLPDPLRRPRVVVGHNVSYDRARVREQYWLESTGTRFVDTLSLHVCVGGLTSGQRAALKSAQAPAPEDAAWREVAALNSLSEVHRLYCGAPLDKVARDLFVTGTLDEVREDFQRATHYCAEDTAATLRVLTALLPLFLERFPHPVTLAGMMELGRAYLPVGPAWPRFLAAAEAAFEELRDEVQRLLARAADDACRLAHEGAFRRDLWMWDQDWSTQELKMKKAPSKRKAEEEFDEEEWPEKFRALAATRRCLPACRPLLPGYPAWYRRLCDRPGEDEWAPGPQRISTGQQVTPKLLRLTWEGYPLHYVREYGWGFLVPKDEEEEEGEEEDAPRPPLKELRARCPAARPPPPAPEPEDGEPTLRREVQERLGWASRRGQADASSSSPPTWYGGAGVWCGAVVGGCWMLKLPHKDGAERVGSPLAKDFVGAFSARVLAGQGAGAERALDIGRQLSYWRNNRDRVLGQVVGWLPPRDRPRGLRDADVGAILPQVVSAGTLTRRAVEPTWMTAANARPGRLGSELRALVHAPPGHALVGADVDSQELWIASALGDAPSGLHGATPFGWMTLSGAKADATDMHSVTAAAAGVSRDHAKVLNYARIYGAGPRFAERLLQRFNPALSAAEARERAGKMFALTKGRRVYRPREEYIETLGEEPRRVSQARRDAIALGVALDEAFAVQWEGGTESAMFNRLEAIAGAAAPETPFLRGRLSRALEAAGDGDPSRFLPTRVNWVVQSGAVDFLHLMLVSMRWLQPRARFCLSFHDEVRYLVPRRDRYASALALHATNLLARAFCASRLGLRDLPAAVAFFASVEVDAALRKEAHHDCVTPSNPRGLRRGYGVPPGESLDVYAAVRLAGRVLRAPKDGPARAPAAEDGQDGEEETAQHT